jgi:hypothetical protein
MVFIIHFPLKEFLFYLHHIHAFCQDKYRFYYSLGQISKGVIPGSLKLLSCLRPTVPSVKASTEVS